MPWSDTPDTVALMAVASRDIVIEGNASFSLPLRWLNKDKTPKPLSSYEAKMQVRVDPESADALITVDSEGIGGITLAEAGDVDVFIGATKTAALMPYRGKVLAYDIVLTHRDDAEIKIKLLRGAVRVDPGVTR